MLLIRTLCSPTKQMLCPLVGRVAGGGWTATRSEGGHSTLPPQGSEGMSEADAETAADGQTIWRLHLSTWSCLLHFCRSAQAMHHCLEAIFIEPGHCESIRKEGSPSCDCKTGWRKVAKHIYFCTCLRWAFSPSVL